MLARLTLDAPPKISAMGIPRHGESTNSDSYLLPEHWCFHIYAYRGTLELDGCAHELRPGDASLIPPGVRMGYRYEGPSEHVYCHFKLSSGEHEMQLPMVLSLGSQYDSMDRRARQAVLRGRTDPSYSTAAFWNLLWEYADLCTGKLDARPQTRHPLVGSAVQHIEQQLSSSLSVKRLCEEVGVSYGYLTRLFSQHLGVSVSEYVRSRRAEQAAHLLASTNMPIKAIARAVGVPRLSQFNRLMHDVYGQSPRSLRASTG